MLVNGGLLVQEDGGMVQTLWLSLNHGFWHLTLVNSTTKHHNFQGIWVKKHWLWLFSIAGIFPRASSKGGAHGSQSDDSTYLARTWEICDVVFTSPLTSRLCCQLQELQGLPTSPLKMWSSSKSISFYSQTWSLTRVPELWSRCTTTELSTLSVCSVRRCSCRPGISCDFFMLISIKVLIINKFSTLKISWKVYTCIFFRKKDNFNVEKDNKTQKKWSKM